MLETRQSKYGSCLARRNQLILTDIRTLQDFIPKLKSHLLPRIQAILKQEALHEDIGSIPPHGSLSSSEDLDHNKSEEANLIFLKNDCIYEHNIVKINYTTYDT
jgi:hypothetical protein